MRSCDGLVVCASHASQQQLLERDPTVETCHHRLVHARTCPCSSLKTETAAHASLRVCIITVKKTAKQNARASEQLAAARLRSHRAGYTASIGACERNTRPKNSATVKITEWDSTKPTKARSHTHTRTHTHTHTHTHTPWHIHNSQRLYALRHT